MAKRSAKHKQVQKQGKQRDNFMCFICAEVSPDVEGHHMLLHSEDGPENVNNIITLCKQCHRDYHAGRLKISFYLKDLS